MSLPIWVQTPDVGIVGDPRPGDTWIEITDSNALLCVGDMVNAQRDGEVISSDGFTSGFFDLSHSVYFGMTARTYLERVRLWQMGSNRIYRHINSPYLTAIPTPKSKWEGGKKLPLNEIYSKPLPI